MSDTALTRNRYKIAISGYYGCGNAGDEAVLAGIIESFKLAAPDRVEFTVLSANPADTIRLHQVNAVDRMNLSALLKTMRESDLLISGGGSLLQDTTSIRSLIYYLWIIRMAYSHCLPVMFYAQGLGPLHRPLSRRLVRIAANRARVITVRDEPSRLLLNRIRVTKPPIELAADPAFALSAAPEERIKQIRAEEGLVDTAKWIGLSLRTWGGAGESPVKSYAELIYQIYKLTGSRVALIPMQVPGDLRFAETVREQVQDSLAVQLVSGNYSPQELMGLVGSLEAMVAMRLHSLIFAARMCVPLFALSYDPKVENLMSLLGLDDAIDHWRGFDPIEVAGRIATILADRPSHVDNLRRQHDSLESLARSSTAFALNILHESKAH